MAPLPGPTLRKVTLNLYDEDVAFLETHLGLGWSALARQCISDWVLDIKRKQGRRPTTLEELNDQSTER